MTEAAAFPLATLTAWRMVVTKARRSSAGDDVLIWGIGGGVALAALQICKLAGRPGVGHLGERGEARTRPALGADELLLHHRRSTWDARCGRGRASGAWTW